MPRPNKAEQKFALDVVDRCTAEINQAHAAYAGDADKLKKLSYARHAIVKCYMRDHAQCRKHSLERINYIRQREKNNLNTIIPNQVIKHFHIW